MTSHIDRQRECRLPPFRRSETRTDAALCAAGGRDDIAFITHLLLLIYR
jgi:hypothetical protein